MMTEEQQAFMEKIHDVNFKLISELDRLCRKYNITYYLAFGGLLGVMRHGDFIPWDNDVDVVMTRREFAKLERHFDELSEDFEYIRPADYKEKYFDMVPRINYVKSEFHMFPEKDAFYNNMNNKIALDFFFIDKTYPDWRGTLYKGHMMFLYGMANAHRYKLELDMYSGIFKAAAIVLYGMGKLIPAPVLRNWIRKSVHRFDKDEKAPGYAVTNDTIDTFSKYFPREVFDGVKEMEIRGKKFMVPNDSDQFLRIEYGNYMELPPEEKRIPHFGPYLLDIEKFKIED